MGKLIQFPCRDYYDDYDYDEYYGEEFAGNEHSEENLTKESFIRGFIRKLLMFVLNRL